MQDLSTFFTIGIVPDEAAAQALCDAMPPEFRKKGHFTIGPIGNNGPHAGKWIVKWDCHALTYGREWLDLPFEVEHLMGAVKLWY